MPHPAMRGQATRALTAGQRRRSLIAIFGSIFSAGLAFGTSIPLLSLLLERAGTESSIIGLNAAMPVLATVVCAPLLPHLVDRLGTLPALFGGIALMVAATLLLPVFPTVEAWFPLRFLVGVGMSVHWVVSETWLNAATTTRNRGLIAGLYATVISLGFAAGPLMLTVIDLDGLLPFLLIAGFIASGGLPLALAWDCAPTLKVTVEGSAWGVLRLAPVIMGAILVSGFVDSAIMSLLPIYGLRAGMGEAPALLMLTVAITGSVMLQLPLGWLSDRVNRRSLILICAVVGVLGPALLPLAIAEPLLLWPLLFVWGGIIVGLYTVGLAMLGDRFEGGDLARANAMFVMVYCLGSIFGPPLTGAAMDLLGREGLPIVLTGVCVVFLLLALRRSG